MSRPSDRAIWSPLRLVVFFIVWLNAFWLIALLAGLVPGFPLTVPILVYLALPVWYVWLYRRHRPAAPPPTTEW